MASRVSRADCTSPSPLSEIVQRHAGIGCARYRVKALRPGNPASGVLRVCGAVAVVEGYTGVVRRHLLMHHGFLGIDLVLRGLDARVIIQRDPYHIGHTETLARRRLRLH